MPEENECSAGNCEQEQVVEPESISEEAGPDRPPPSLDGVELAKRLREQMAELALFALPLQAYLTPEERERFHKTLGEAANAHRRTPEAHALAVIEKYLLSWEQELKKERDKEKV